MVRVFDWFLTVFVLACVSWIPVSNTYSYSKYMDEKEKKSVGNYAWLTLGYIVSILCVAVTVGVFSLPVVVYIFTNQNIFSEK
jgi:hypothetical protein